MIVPNYREYLTTQTASRRNMIPHGWDMGLAGAAESREKLIQAATILFGSREAAIAFLDGVEERAQDKVRSAVKPLMYAAIGAGAVGAVLGIVALVRSGR